MAGREMTAKRSIKRSEKRSEDDEIYDQVAQKAYELFVRRGCIDGHDVEDWLEAEQMAKMKVRTTAL